MKNVVKGFLGLLFFCFLAILSYPLFIIFVLPLFRCVLSLSSPFDCVLASFSFVLPLYIWGAPEQIAFILSYIIGSVPFSLIIAKMQGRNLKKTGSGGVGATNALETVGKKSAIFAFTLNSLKGFMAVYLTAFLCASSSYCHGNALITPEFSELIVLITNKTFEFLGYRNSFCKECYSYVYISGILAILGHITPPTMLQKT